MSKRKSASATDGAPELTYRVTSKEGKEFRVSEGAIEQCLTLHTMIAQLFYTPEDIETKDAFPIQNVSSKTLKLIFKWCEHNKGKPIKDENDLTPPVVTPFDEELLKIDMDFLHEVIMAANFLNVAGLLDVACAKVAKMGEGLSPARMRVVFRVPTNEEDRAAQKAAADAAAAAAASAAADATDVSGAGTSSG
ncbi:hypothetical protein CAEBREN_11080 [Caenorhabditis brenneri]|uniref:Skp1-related protein n=1 Tax=Caenorhabditis brenneri TaxID=135651 RepID=G0MX20_CAEBE|nr:hypothetical protein CAEBREN_11080 [Caenorhabditis brenneri]